MFLNSSMLIHTETVKTSAIRTAELYVPQKQKRATEIPLRRTEIRSRDTETAFYTNKRLFAFNFRNSPCCMPEAKDKHCIWIVEDLINNPIRPMNDLSDGFELEFGNNAPSFRKSAKGKRLIDKRIAKLHCPVRIIPRYERDNLP